MITTNKPITKRAYIMLVNKVSRLAHEQQTREYETDELHSLRAKLAAYSIDCPGEAHSNAFIDNCMLCAPQWGKIQNPELRK